MRAAPAQAVAVADSSEVIRMQRRILAQIGDLEAALHEPREIRIERDKGGKIKGASSSAGGRDAGRQAA